MTNEILKRGRILVTGADGFIGSHLVEELVAQGCHVRALIQYNFRNSWGWLDDVGEKVRAAIEVFPADIRDPQSARSAVEGCSVVLHLAALISIPYSYRSPDSYLETNGRGTLNLLVAARDAGVERFIHTSTSEVYGTPQSVPIQETHRLNAQSPYAASKIGADQMAMSFYHSFGLPVSIVRPFNNYGPRQSARAVIPTIITQLLADSPKLKLGSLHPTRDFLFVRDSVRGFIAACTHDKAVGELIQLGTGHEISIGDVARLLGELLNRKVDFATDEARIRPTGSEVERLVADCSKAKALLNWTPEYAGVSGLRKGLLETIQWFSAPKNLGWYRPEIYQV